MITMTTECRVIEGHREGEYIIYLQIESLEKCHRSIGYLLGKYLLDNAG